MSGDRLTAPDVLRGIAIAGTFASNVWVFADPRGPAAVLAGPAGSWWPDTALRALANGKFLALLNLLFGIGMELQYRSAVRRGLRWPGRYLARAGILFVEGLLHYVLVFEFDVLTGYAVAAVLVAWLVGRGVAVRLAAASVAGTLVLLVVAAVTMLPAGGPGGPVPAYPPTWGGQVWQRLTEPLVHRVELVLIVPSAVVLFLAGSALLRAGVLDPGGTRVRARLMAAGVVGVVADTATVLAGPAWFAVERYLAAPLVALGLLGLVPAVLLRMRGPAGRVRRGLTALGRTAMSCYVGQNLLGGVVFHAWGLGLAGTLAGAAPPLRTAAVAGVWAGVMVISAVAASGWLRGHERGPLETVAHALLSAPRAPGSPGSRRARRRSGAPPRPARPGG